ncbi:MAG: DUF1592 domain-containing protein [Bryobacteraceae bacterium]
MIRILLVLSAAAAFAATFEGDVRPVLVRYCFTCHSTAKHVGDLDLERFRTEADIAKDTRPWQKMVEQLSLGEMPPKAMPQPAAAERASLISWVNGALAVAARAKAGDPGPVVLRRLDNAEYTYTVRDLTGVATLDPAKEFPADGAAGEGFMNTGNALSMSPALVSKYLDAGKAIASHAMLTPTGIRFSAAASRRDWTDELLAEIRAFYSRHTEAGGVDTVTQQGIALDKNRGGTIPLKRYLSASLELRDAASAERIATVAKRHSLSPKYMATLVALLAANGKSPVLDGVRAKWRKGDVDGAAKEIELWQNTLWKFSSVGHIGKVDGPKAWMEPVTPIVAKQDFRVKLPAADGADTTVYLAAHNAGDGATGDAVVWHEPRIAIAGRAPILARDLRAFLSELSARRVKVFAATAASLNAVAEGSRTPSDDATKAWFDYLGAGAPAEYKLALLAKKVEKSSNYDFVQGWSEGPVTLLANSSDRHVRVPGNMKPHGVAMHPSPTHYAAAGWLSPVAATVRVESRLQRAHPECGNGITWSLEMRRGSTRQRLAEGEARNAAAVTVGPFERVQVQEGDLISLLIGPREANHSCDLTDVEVRIDKWSLAADVSGKVLAGNPNGVWRFYSEPVTGEGSGTVIPAGSLLARWQSADDASEKRRLAAALEKLLTGPAPTARDATPDAALYRQLASLAGPLFAGVNAPATREPADIRVQAPAVTELRLPADLVVNSEFVTTGTTVGTVQLEVTTAKPSARSELLVAGTGIGDAKGTWSSNNQTVSYAMPVIANEAAAGRKQMEAAFEEFRRVFPASLCYTKIVPVDEVVTLTLYHREDTHLSRLILNDAEKAKLDRLWDELHYVSRDAITLVDAFEQLWQYATQDADPSKFEPLRKPIMDRAAAFRKTLAVSEPRHVDAVVEFAGRAYRRRVTAAEEQQLRGLYAQLRKQELPHEDAIRLMLARVLVSPAFLYRTEQTKPGKLATPVSGDEIASRLSYFLWSSQPDAELRAAAEGGKLATAAGVREQARRMVRDARVRRLATEFGAAWLHIYGFDTLDEKSERHFPEFRDLRAPMYEEAIEYLADLFRNNGSVLSLVKSDHSFLNEALAKHYGIPGVAGSEFRRVDGVAKYSRGGVLGQGAVLAKQAGASRTSPILRGNWLLEVMLGEKLPRPPKDVPPLPTEEGPELSMRAMTERHTKDPRCSGCHIRVDPFGFTLERFDAVGKLRDKDLGGRPIDDRATVKDGTVIDGLEGLKQYVLGKGRPAFLHQFTKKLLGYALGRAVVLSDEPLLAEIQTQLAANEYRVGTAIDMIVTSRQFREIRGKDHEQEHE